MNDLGDKYKEEEEEAGQPTDYFSRRSKELQ